MTALLFVSESPPVGSPPDFRPFDPRAVGSDGAGREEREALGADLDAGGKHLVARVHQRAAGVNEDVHPATSIKSR